jgi:hypothetical protein
MNSKIKNLAFIFLLVIIYFFFDFDSILLKFPQGVHFIRQTDSLAFAAHYYHFGFHFFKPGLFNLMSENAYAVCEFPIIYYITAFLYLLFGEQEFILKSINLLILSIGCYHLFRLSMLLLKDFALSILTVFFLFSSVAFVYYGFNYLPDSAALGLTFSAWYFYHKFLEVKNLKALFYCFSLLTLAALLKATYFIQPIAIILLLIIVYKDDIKFYFRKIFPFFLISGFIVLIWNLYVFYFNAKHHSDYFTTSTLPIWDLSKNEISLIWDEMLGEWYKKYLAESSFHFYLFICLIGLYLGIVRYKKLLILIVILFLGTLSYFILFYQQFKHHDYYFLLMIPFVYFSLVLGLKGISEKFKNKPVFISIFKLVFFVVVIAGINYSSEKFRERYEKGKDDFSKIAFDLKENETFISTLKFSVKAKLIIAEDKSVNGGLYFMKRKGWLIDSIKDDFINKINQYKEKGANYLIVIDYKKYALKMEGLLNYCKVLSKNEKVIVYEIQKVKY